MVLFWTVIGLCALGVVFLVSIIASARSMTRSEVSEAMRRLMENMEKRT